MRFIISIVFLLTFFAQNIFSQNIATGKEVLEYLAADEQKGRFPGTPEDKDIQKFLDKKFYKGWMGKFSFGYIQPFTIQTGISIGKPTSLQVANVVATPDDFAPFVLSAETSAIGQLIYAGQTMKNTNVDVAGKWALIYLDNENDLALSFKYLFSEIMEAKEKKAKGLVFAARNNLTKEGEFYPFNYTRAVVSLNIPVVQVSRNFLQQVMEKQGLTLRKLRKSSPKKINKKLEDIEVQVTIDFDRELTKTANVAAYVEGSESNEWVVVGAHYDHLGFGGRGTGSRAPDEHAVHNGADDNASGVAMVMMLAEYYKKNPPKSNMAFVLFGAEEMGLLGSKHFVKNLPFPKEKIKAMVNYDMVGRVEDSALSISGVKTAEEYESLLSHWQKDPLKLSLGGAGFSGSDQASFYSENIPVLFFNSGLHEDYHTPDDDIEKINYPGMEMVAELSVKMLDSLTNPAFDLTFQKAKSNNKGRYGKKIKVTLGIMPDVAGTTKNGLGVDGVTAGKPADKAGIKKGDAIVEIGGKKVANIYEYMHHLSELKEGQKVTVKVRREGEIISLPVQF